MLTLKQGSQEAASLDPLSLTAGILPSLQSPVKSIYVFCFLRDLQLSLLPMNSQSFWAVPVYKQDCVMSRSLTPLQQCLCPWWLTVCCINLGISPPFTTDITYCSVHCSSFRNIYGIVFDTKVIYNQILNVYLQQGIQIIRRSIP